MTGPIRAIALSIALVALPTGAAALADSSREAPVTPATTWHGTPGNTPGFSNQQNGACPATAGGQCDGGMHGIATNPGQSGNKPQDRNEPPSCDMHGGFNGIKKNCN